MIFILPGYFYYLYSKSEGKNWQCKAAVCYTVYGVAQILFYFILALYSLARENNS
jgi:hypothetical protein